jgi:hypothetical protein
MSNRSLTEIHAELMASIQEIDQVLDTLSGSKTAGRRKIINDMVSNAEGTWQPVAEQVSDFLKGMDESQRTAVFFGVVETLRKEFEKAASSYVEAVVDAQPKQEAVVTPEQAEQLNANRKELYAKIKPIVELAEQIEGETLEMPKVRRGSSGPRGKRAMSLLTYFIDGEEVDMTPGQIAKENGYEAAKDFTQALRDAGYDVSTVTEINNFKLPNGKVLNAVLDDGSDEEEESDED